MKSVKRRNHRVGIAEYVAETMKITEGHGLNLIWASGTISQSLECLAFGGILALIGFLPPAI